MHFDDFDAAMHRLDEQLYGGEPDEPDWAWYDRPPSPRQRRRARHREWQRRDRESRAGQPPPSDAVRVLRPPF